MIDETRNKISKNDEEIDFSDLYKKLEKYKLTDRQLSEEELPKLGLFDLYASLSDDLTVFGLMKDFSKSGWAVKYTGNVKVKNQDGIETDMKGTLGYIMAESNNRIIIQTK